MKQAIQRFKLTLFYFYRYFFSLSSHYPKLKYILIVALLLQNALFIFSSFLVKWFFEIATTNKNVDKFFIYFLAAFFCVIMISASYFLTDYLSAKLGTLMFNRLRIAFYHKIQKISLSILNQFPSSHLLSLFSEEFALLRIAINYSLWYSQAYLCFIPIGIFFLAYFNLTLTLSIVLLIPIFLYVSNKLNNQATGYVEKKKIMDSQAVSIVREELRLQLMSRILGVSHFRSTKFQDLLSTAEKIESKHQILVAWTKTCVSTGQYIIRIATIALGSYLVLIGHMTVSTLIAYTVLLNSVTACANLFATHLTTLLQAVHALGSILHFLATPEIQTSENLREFRALQSSITFQNVCLDKEGYRILDNIQLCIKKGQFIGITGQSGSGKTQLLQLLLGQELPTAGEILIDGYPVSSYQIDSLLRKMGVVLHEPSLFELSILDNIRMGRLDATEEEVYEAAQLAEIHDEIMKMPNGYQTIIAEYGNNLSAGQRQRIALSRALINKPSLLLLDEVTANLDITNKRNINQTLSKIAHLTTTVRITHDLSEVEKADKIYTLNHGKIGR